jgi:DNA-binding winged helix-turn-helix (wHTH) protein
VRVRFADCVFDSERHELICRGEQRSLQPKAFAFLGALIESHPAAVSKETLYERIWPGLFVEEGNLHNLAADVREAIGDSDRTIIRTVHRVGYALATPLTRDEPTPARLIIGTHELPLASGETVIGRDLIGTPDVSRRHASLVVRDGRVFLRDLDSKNGTFIGSRRIDGETELTNGDEITFGRTRAVIWLQAHNETTITANENR